MKACLIPGTFDPVTLGHVDMIERAAALFDEVTVAILRNPDKRGWLDWDERAALLEAAVAQSGATGRARVIQFEGLLIDCARSVGADAIVRGLRSVGDFEYEAPWARINRGMASIETVFIVSPPGLAHVSSSAARQLAAAGGPLDMFVPEAAMNILKQTGRITIGGK